MGGLFSSATGVNMKSREAVLVQNTVQENPVVLFSKSYCPYCKTAKGIFTNLGVTAKVLELDEMEQGPVMQNVLEAMTKAKTVPRVFINGQCIGGCSELKSLLASGQLQQMLES